MSDVRDGEGCRVVQSRPMYPECVAFLRKTMRVRDVLILLSLSLSWFCAKMQRIPDAWDATLRVASHECVLTQR